MRDGFWRIDCRSVVLGVGEGLGRLWCKWIGWVNLTICPSRCLVASPLRLWGVPGGMLVANSLDIVLVGGLMNGHPVGNQVVAAVELAWRSCPAECLFGWLHGYSVLGVEEVVCQD